MVRKKHAPDSAFIRSGARKRRKKMGRPRKVIVKLKSSERQRLQAMLRRGRESARVIRRAQVLELLHKGRTYEQIADAIGASETMARNVGKRYMTGGLKRALRDAPRPGARRVLNSSQEQELVAVLCGPSPKGRARWTIKLAAEAAVGEGIIASIGRETVRRTMKRHDIKPWREKNVVRGEAGRGVRQTAGESAKALRPTVEPAGTGGVSR